MNANIQHSAAQDLADLMRDGYMMWDLADKLTCHEAETFADFMRAFDLPADSFLVAHAEGDDDGDTHYVDAAGKVQRRCLDEDCSNEDDHPEHN